MSTDNRVIVTYALSDYIVVDEPVDDDFSDWDIFDDDDDYIDETPKLPETPKETTTNAPEEPKPTTPAKSSSSNYDWRQFLKDYEEWVDSYVILLNKYMANPLNLSILTDYLEQMEKLVEWSEKADQIEIDLANDPGALKEYLETLTRILLKLF